MSNWMKNARAQAIKSPTLRPEPVITPTTPTPARVWSTKQEAIFAWFVKDQTVVYPGHGIALPDYLVVMARAGTGKTTTIIEAIDRAPEERILLAAFNKSIANELKVRITNPNAEAKTLHSVGFSIIRQTHPRCCVEQRSGSRAWELAQAGAQAVLQSSNVPKGAGKAELPDGVDLSVFDIECRLCRCLRQVSSLDIERRRKPSECVSCLRSKRPYRLWTDQADDILVEGFNFNGPMPEASLSHVDFATALRYGCRDADATVRVKRTRPHVGTAARVGRVYLPVLRGGLSWVLAEDVAG